MDRISGKEQPGRYAMDRSMSSPAPSLPDLKKYWTRSVSKHVTNLAGCFAFVDFVIGKAIRHSIVAISH